MKDKRNGHMPGDRSGTGAAPGSGPRDDGELVSATEIYSDGSATFSLDGEGKLIWRDEKENAGDGMLFEKVSDYEEEIPAEELAEGWIKVICGVEQGTAGALR